MVVFEATESTDNASWVVWESEGLLRLNPRAQNAEVVCMHSWVFRHRKHLMALYGPPRLRNPDLESSSDPKTVKERFPTVERKDGGEVILHPAIAPVVRATGQIEYRRGA